MFSEQLTSNFVLSSVRQPRLFHFKSIFSKISERKHRLQKFIFNINSNTSLWKGFTTFCHWNDSWKLKGTYHTSNVYNLYSRENEWPGQNDLTQFELGLESSATTELSLRLAKLVFKNPLKYFNCILFYYFSVWVVCVSTSGRAFEGLRSMFRRRNSLIYTYFTSDFSILSFNVTLS